MIYLKLYENFFINQIKKVCQRYKIKNYTISQDGTVDVDGEVYLHFQHLTKLPLKFGKVSKNFYCGNNNLTTLDGSPKWTGGGFFCFCNQLTSLKGGPIEVDGVFKCSENQLTTLVGGPSKVGSDYFCGNNDLRDLNGFPDNFIGHHFNLSPNPVCEITELVGSVMNTRIKFTKWINEYDVIRDGNKIVEMRLEEAYWMTTKKELPLDKRIFKNYTLI